MNKIIIRNGLISAAIIVIASLIPWMIGGFKQFSYQTMATMGYLIILAALSFVLLGVREYKLQSPNFVSFYDALKVGLLIVIFPAVGFFIYTAFFMSYMGEDFLQHSIEQAKLQMPPKEFEKYLVDVEKNKATYLHPIFQGGIMFITVYAFGFIVALLSAWWLPNKQKG